ncbi:MAG TPA: rhodanese-like domain-containing protein [Planctomycetota bacterium]|nr:rhodanese-like domain-containing protein [Planctomycetota bacterium]
MAVQPIEPAELKRRLEAGEELVLLDVREPDEVAICRIGGSLNVPMSEITARLAELDPDRPTVCICHHGIRSANIAAALERLEFDELYNLAGGIDRWAEEVEPSMGRY